MRECRRFLIYLRPYKVTALLAFVFAFVSSLSLVAATYFSGLAVDQMPSAGAVSFQTLGMILIALLVVYLLASFFQWFIARYANKISYFVVRDLRRETFNRLEKLPISFYDTNAHGDLVSRFTNDLDAVSDGLSVLILNLFSGFVTVLASLFVMLCLNVALALTVLLVTPLCVLFAAVITRFCQKSFQKQQESVGRLSGFVAEMVGNQKTVQAFSREDQERREFEQIAEELRQTASKAVFGSAIINPGTRFVNNICYITVGVVGGILAIHGDVTVGIVTSFLIYAGQFAKPFNEISGITAQLQTAVASLKRIFALLDETPEDEEAEDAQVLTRCSGRIAFENVSFSYQSGKSVLENLSFRALPGQTIALVGPTGCGKTTIVNLLMRFYEIDKGRITIDGTDIRLLTKRSLRRSFGMILQDSWLFSGTVAQNIAYGNPNASMDQIVAAAKDAHAHSFIQRLPNGYHTRITDDALSVGERQLLTIARGMLAGHRMLILDEATSSIDSLTEWRVQQAFDKLMEGKTSIVIAHRLSTIRAADLILVMKDGKIIERGTHHSLLENKGFYYELYHSQFAQ